MLTQEQPETVTDEDPLDDLAAAARTLKHAPTIPPPRPAWWPSAVAWGAALSHVMAALGLIAFLLPGPSSEPATSALLGLGAMLAPVGALCGLAGILLVRWHLNGWIVLVSILTLPLNILACLIIFSFMVYGC